MISEDDLERLHRQQQAWDKRQRYVNQARDRRRMMAERIEARVRESLEARGYFISRPGANEHYDLLVNGIRVEVKASAWSKVRRRYMARLRANRADVLVFCCLNSREHYFVIPFERVEGVTTIEIWSHDPRDYIGIYTPFYGAWEVLDERIARGENAFQRPIF